MQYSIKLFPMREKYNICLVVFVLTMGKVVPMRET